MPLIFSLAELMKKRDVLDFTNKFIARMAVLSRNVGDDNTKKNEQLTFGVCASIINGIVQRKTLQVMFLFETLQNLEDLLDPTSLSLTPKMVNVAEVEEFIDMNKAELGTFPYFLQFQV